MIEAQGWISCPWCGAQIRLYAAVGADEPPDPGDHAICGGCLRIGIFQMSATGLVLRRANAWETQVVMADPEMREVRAALQRSETAQAAADELRRMYAQTEEAEEAENSEHPEQHE